MKTKIRQSSIHGLGLFADQMIPKDAEIWRFTPGFDRKLTREDILAFPKALQIWMYSYSWRSKKSKLYMLCPDDAKYINHARPSNCVSVYRADEDEVVTVAVRNISAGEELTDDYDSFEDERSEGDVLDEIAERYGLVDELDPRFKVPSRT